MALLSAPIPKESSNSFTEEVIQRAALLPRFGRVIFVPHAGLPSMQLRFPANPIDR
jgi:hypothetical protein